jgi:hypothetical protein
MAKKVKTVQTKVRDLSAQAEKMGLPKRSGPTLYLGTSGSSHRPPVDYTQLSEDEGYPRGFTPSQMQEVKKSEKAGHLFLESDAPTEGADFSERPHPEHEKSRMREIIARSRVEPSIQFKPHEFDDLQGASFPLTITAHKDYDKAPGQYIHHDPSTDIRARDIEINTEQLFPEKVTQDTDTASGDALIHEIGHDYDYTNDITEAELGAEHAAMVDQIKQVGDLLKISPIAGYKAFQAGQPIWQMSKSKRGGFIEGTADKYSAENFVADPRDVKKRRAFTDRDNSLYSAEAAVGMARFGRTGDVKHPLSAWATGYGHAGGKFAAPGSHKLTYLEDAARALPPTSSLAASGTSNTTMDPVELENQDIYTANKK